MVVRPSHLYDGNPCTGKTTSLYLGGPLLCCPWWESWHNDNTFFPGNTLRSIYLGRRHNGECVHDPVRVFFSYLADEQGAHTGAGTAPKWVCELEALQTVAVFRFLPDHIKHSVDELSALGVVTFGPVVSGSALAKDETFRTEYSPIWTRPDRIHSAGFQIQQDGARDELATWLNKVG